MDMWGSVGEIEYSTFSRIVFHPFLKRTFTVTGDMKIKIISNIKVKRKIIIIHARELLLLIK